jgi:Clr5 domain
MPPILIMEFMTRKGRLASSPVGPLKSTSARAHARGSSATPPTTAEWDRHRERIHDLYKKQQKTLKDVAQIMFEEHGFFAT